MFSLSAVNGGEPPGYLLTYYAEADALPPDVLHARREREAAVTPKYMPGSNWAISLRSMQSLRAWIYTEHKAYAASRLLDQSWHAPKMDGASLRSYRH